MGYSAKYRSLLSTTTVTIFDPFFIVLAISIAAHTLAPDDRKPNVVQGAVLAGAEKIIAVDLLESRLEHAKRFGATHAVNASAGDPVEQIRDLTGGRGVDYAFEVIGLPITMRQAYECLDSSAS